MLLDFAAAVQSGDFFFLSRGSDPVPPNATVVFEVEVFTVSRGPRSMEAFKEMDLNQDRSLTKEEVTVWSAH